MLKMSFLPLYVRAIFKGMPIVWKNRHALLFCWVVVMQASVPGRKTVKELSRWTPAWITEWRYCRLLRAGYWSIQLLVTWFAMETIKSFPPPEDGIVYLVGDGSHKDKRGKNNPTVQKGRKGKNKPFFFGIRFVLMALCWDVYRIPVGFRIVLPKDHPDYQKENALFREMVDQFIPPAWAKVIIVVGDAGFGCKDNMKMVQKRNRSDADREWYFVFAIARTWKKEDGKSIKDMVNYLPRNLYKRTWIAPLNKEGKRKTFWIFGKIVCLRHVGEVTVVMSKKGRNVGPKRTKILVTNLPGATPRQVISIYQRRWPIEIIFKELKSDLGLGQHQVTKDERRVEKSIGIAIIAYLFLLRVRKQDIKPGHSWGISQLQNNFRLDLVAGQIRHSMELKLKKLKNAA